MLQDHQSFEDYENFVSVPKIGEVAPQFEATAVVNKEFKHVSLKDYRGKWVVLFFYPLDFTFVCPTEITGFSDAAATFREMNAEVIGASVDSQFSHLAWINTPRTEGGLGDLDIPLIADMTKDLSFNYGALYKNTGHALRARYIIDPEGKIRHITMNDPPVGRNVDEVIRLVKGYQHADEHGEVCPLGWTPGKDTIKPNPKDSLEFFRKQ